ncbi:MAG: superoxide dismutase [Candidatus Dojkabacteria bacterium]|nr:superoxide dismutase [Candidatus Dojkabacteria bacterium]
MMVRQQYTLPELPYEYSALEPVISAETMRLHHGTHHAAYVKGANSALELLERSRTSEHDVDVSAVLRSLSFNVNGHVLHDIFWKSMRAPQKRNKPSAMLEKIFDETFGCFDDFISEFKHAALKVEGSGWAVLSKDPDNGILITQVEKHTVNHIAGYTPVLTLDVWEHAYYLDYRSDRGAYIDAWWDVVNWDFVEQRLTGNS